MHLGGSRPHGSPSRRCSTSTFKNRSYCERDAGPCAAIFLDARFIQEILQALTERQLLEKDSTWNPCNVIHTRTMALSVRWQQRFLAGLAGEDWLNPMGQEDFWQTCDRGGEMGACWRTCVSMHIVSLNLSGHRLHLALLSLEKQNKNSFFFSS